MYAMKSNSTAHIRNAVCVGAASLQRRIINFICDVCDVNRDTLKEYIILMLNKLYSNKAVIGVNRLEYILSCIQFVQFAKYHVLVDVIIYFCPRI